MRRITQVLLAWLCFTLACSESDIRNTKPDRTRDADGIITLYKNRRQGDWMLKGKVIRVEQAVVVATAPNGSQVELTGRSSLTPIPILITFHSSEKGQARMTPGDLLTFKGICTGMDEAIGFESCVTEGRTQPLSPP